MLPKKEYKVQRPVCHLSIYLYIYCWKNRVYKSMLPKREYKVYRPVHYIYIYIWELLFMAIKIYWKQHLRADWSRSAFEWCVIRPGLHQQVDIEFITIVAMFGLLQNTVLSADWVWYKTNMPTAERKSTMRVCVCVCSVCVCVCRRCKTHQEENDERVSVRMVKCNPVNAATFLK